MPKLAEAIDTYGVDVHDYLDRDFDIPVLSGPQRQGDVMIVPSTRKAVTEVTADGVAVVKGEAGGNTHRLLGLAGVRFDGRTASATNLVLGHLSVDEGCEAFLAHNEHGYLGIAPGNYEIRRQREQADELRIVAD